ncbi:MAG: efflux RND transporter periplasmic adaptor subunit [Bacteroidales bacterium]|nr:efflux RND transporter periplasmic adaptor subunit [Bacteroidales bacterium]
MKKQALQFCIVGAAICLALPSCKKRSDIAPVPSATRVSVITVSDARAHYEQNYSGTVEEESAAALSFQTAGSVQAVYVFDGMAVKKGQKLAELDPVSLKNAHDVTLSTLRQAQDAYKRYEKLHKKGSMTDIQWEEVKTKLQQAVSMEGIAKKNLENAVLKAPFDGIIAEKKIETGITVLPGVPVMKLVTIDNVNVKVPVPENEIADTRIGQEARIRVPALRNKEFRGKITEKSVTANPISRTYDVKIAIGNPEQELMPGMVCKVDITDTENGVSGLVVPNSCIQIDYAGHAFVWLVRNNMAVKRIVTVGGLTETGALVTAGLESGDQLIVEGVQKVSEGSNVIVR